MNHSTFMGIDIAKRSIAQRVASQDGSLVLERTLTCNEVLDFLSGQPTYWVVIACCGSAHYFDWSTQALSHEIS